VSLEELKINRMFENAALIWRTSWSELFRPNRTRELEELPAEVSPWKISKE
jgi:hypothetical protein